ncbi:RDD family protein [Actinomadura flavalba]|uniref:RDD family protein n=1 Tax=Actinomadura flavalba TaxID=1120938 RepID=UPI000369AA51|nr:RDD family protein [Actinomadura flavalba]
MSEHPHRGGQQPPPRGGASWGPPPPYRPPGPQQQPPQQQPPQPRPASDGWQQPPQGGQEPFRTQQFGLGDHAPDAEIHLASVGRRAGARLIDNMLVAVFGFALVLPISIGVYGLGTSGTKAASEGGVWDWPIIGFMFLVLAVLPFVYESVQLVVWGRTLGKRLLHLGVVRQSPAGERPPAAQAVTRAAVNNIGYLLGVFLFLILSVQVWDYAFYGVAAAFAGAVMAYLWAIWDEPLHLALHDRVAGTLVVDEREYADYGEHAH